MNDASRLPTLETPRLLLQPMGTEHVDFLFMHFSRPDVTQYLLDQEPLADRAGAERIVAFYTDPKQTTCARWILVERASGNPIGTCGYHKWNRQHRRAEIGYDLTPAAWGQGLMAEALAVVLDHAFAEMHLHRVDALVYAANERSLRLLEKLRFVREGILRDYFYLNGEHHDHCILSLLAPEKNTPTQ